MYILRKKLIWRRLRCWGSLEREGLLSEEDKKNKKMVKD